VPVWSVIFGVTLLGETLPPQFLAALAVILAGLALSRARAWRRRP
jgi:drug/metabolite transporter (DMT)-like permease